MRLRREGGGARDARLSELILRRQAAIWDAWAHIDPVWAMTGSPTSTGELMASGRLELESFLRDTVDSGLTFGRETALDFGCGVGRVTQAMCAHFVRVYGIDISPLMLDKAEASNRYPGQCIYRLNQRPDLVFIPDQSVDLVYSVNTLWHVPIDLRPVYIAEFIRVLKPSGLAMIQVGSPSRIRRAIGLVIPEGIRAWRFRRRVPDARRGPVLSMLGMPPKTVTRIVARSGGSVVGCSRRGIFPSYYLRRAPASIPQVAR